MRTRIFLAEGTTGAFLWVLLPIVAVPWEYVFGTDALAKER